MKINVSKRLRERSQVGNLVLTALTKLSKQGLVDLADLANNNQVNGEIMLDVNLTIDGIDTNFEELIDRWQSEITRLIKQEAETIVADRMVDVTDLVYKLQSQLQSEVNDRLEDWEKEVEASTVLCTE
mgnify:CR=1 FL=1